MELPLPKERILYLANQVDQASINAITKDINWINKSDDELSKLSAIYGMEYKPKPIKLFIDSYGGACYQCLGLLGIMEKSTAPIHTIVTGCAISAGFIIAVSGHKRFAYDKSTFMYHQPSSALWGKASDLEDGITEVKRIHKIIERHIVDVTKISKKLLRENYKAKKDWYMDSDEALKYKVIDEII